MSDGGMVKMTPTHHVGRETFATHMKGGVGAERTSSRSSSAQSTPRDTPAPTPLQSGISRSFKPDASLVLLGMRGTGKSTLAVIASIACRRRVVDIDHVFQEATGFSTARYRKQFGGPNHNLRQEELLRTVLKTHDKDAIIICNGGSLERNGQLLMQEFAQTHPVVHVVRHVHDIHDYLGGIDLQRLKDMLGFTAPILRSCSNLEFFNVAESKNACHVSSRDQPGAPAFLTLKRAQRTFLKFLSLITSSTDTPGPRGATIPPLEPGYPLSDVATELRRYTCAVQVPLADVLVEEANLQNLETGADAFEITIDPAQAVNLPDVDAMDEIGVCVSKVRRSTVVPIILHVLPPSCDSIDIQSTYLSCVHQGLRTAPEFITFDLSRGEAALAEVVAARGISKVIGCLHTDKTWADPDWRMQYDMAARIGCSLVRFSRPAGIHEDDYHLHKLRFDIKTTRPDSIPLTCYNTGKAGRPSLCLSQHLVPVIPASARNNSDFLTRLRRYPAMPCVTAREITQALYASFTFDAMHIYIIGASLGYSVSPAMHNAAYKTCGMPHCFQRMQSSTLNSLKALVRESNFGGSIVIQPHKVEVISLTDSLSQHARAIGAVNTLIPVRNLKDNNGIPSELELFQERNQSGPVQALYGDNTEWIGIRSCVRRGLSPANAVRPTSSGLVIGAGGMARAAVYALLQLGVKKIVIFNRTVDKAEQLVAHFTRLVSATSGNTCAPAQLQGSRLNFHVLRSREDAWPEAFRQPAIILSCIPADAIDDSPAAQFTLPPAWMRSPTGGVVMEIAYKTLNTPLMLQVREHGSSWTYLDGLDFLPEQAFAQFELFTDSETRAALYAPGESHAAMEDPEDVQDLSSQDADDDFERRMIQSARDERRLHEALHSSSRVHAFRKARTQPRVGLTLDNLERNNARIHSAPAADTRVPAQSPPSSSGSARSDPAMRAPPAWGRKSRSNRNWMRTITYDEQAPTTPPSADETLQGLHRGHRDENSRPRPSIQDSPLSHKSTPRHDRSADWDLTFELNEASIIASTPYIPRNTMLDDIRQRERESARPEAAPESPLHPARRPPSPEKRLRTRTHSWQAMGKSQPVTATAKENSAVAVYKTTTETVSVWEQEAAASTRRGPQKSLRHRNEDSQDLLRRLARASNTPSPGRTDAPRPQTAPASQLSSSSTLTAKDALAASTHTEDTAVKKEPTPDDVANGKAPAAEDVRLQPEPELEDTVRAPEEVPTTAGKTDQVPQREPEPVDATPMPTERRILEAKTPVVTGAWVDTPGPGTTRKHINMAPSPSQSPKRTSPQKNRSPERPKASARAQVDEAPSTEVARPQLPSSALHALVQEAKRQGRRSSADFGDSTINSLEELMSSLPEPPEADEDTLQGLPLPTVTPRNDAERQRQQELLHLHRMNDRLRAARTSIRDASRGMKRVEDRVEHNEDMDSADSIILNCPCAASGHSSPLGSARRALFWSPTLKSRRSGTKWRTLGGLTTLSILLLVLLTWYISEEIACEMYCHHAYTNFSPYPYSVNPHAPRFPFVIPTMLWRKLFWWIPWSSSRWSAGTLRQSVKSTATWAAQSHVAEEEVWDQSILGDEIVR
ncbi:hypothetical protein ACEQ8H_001445 [Pleosporales sp. CAS-2024a]